VASSPLSDRVIVRFVDLRRLLRCECDRP
jgi:hypothetical protein